MKTLKPEVTLHTHTNNPVGAIALAVSAWHAESIDMNMDKETEIKLAKAGIKAFHKTALEYVDFVFVIKNCSRAFQQQLTRTRTASFSIQSMRVIEKQGFASNGNYTMPPGLSEDQEAQFHNSMLAIEDRYDFNIRNGLTAEDARGLLPLNIHSDITMRINLNGIYHMLDQRLCVNTQWEFRQVALQMKQEIKNKIGRILSDPISAPCVKCNKCPMGEDYCGIPVWKLTELSKDDVYADFVNFKKVGKEWDITWANKEPKLGYAK